MSPAPTGVLPDHATLRVVARKAMPAPATGYYPIHAEEERELIERAFDAGPPAPAPGVASAGGRRRSGR